MNNHRARRLTLGPLLLFFQLSFLQAQAGELRPEWFWRTPEHGGTLLAVGYAPVYYTPQSSYDEAFMDGAWRLFTGTQCRVWGEKGVINVPEGMFSVGSTLKIGIDSTRFADFVGQLVRIDSMTGKDMVIMLVGTRDVAVPSRRAPAPPTPELTDLKGPGGHLVAMGGGQPYEYIQSSWKAAEKAALINAAFNLKTIMKHYEALDPGSESRGVQTTVMATDTTLSNIQTVARAVEPATGRRIVFVKAIK